MAHGKSIAESVAGAAAMAFELVAPFRRRARTGWGSTPEERARQWPGDDLVPEPTWQATMAVTVQAPPERVWPWIAQLGQGRGGFYSYERLENLIGCGIENATRIRDELQQVAVGDPIRLHREAPPLVVAQVEPARALVLQGNPAPPADGPKAPAADLATSWALLLDPRGDGATRLLSRTRYRHGKGWRNAALGGPAFIEPVSFVMTRMMLRVLKELIESTGRAAR